MEISVYENEDCAIDFILKYGPFWVDTTKRGDLAASGDFTEIYFYVAPTPGGTTFISATATGGKITWPSAGKIRVALSTETNGHVGDNQFFELRGKMTSGAYVTIQSGTFNVKQSQVERP